MNNKLKLIPRQGPKPETTSNLPHSQLTQHGPDHIVEKLHEWSFALPDIGNQPSGISVPGSRAMVVHDGVACNHEAFMIGREFAHIHPHPDSGSMHLMLPAEDAVEVTSKGWGEDHYLVTQGHWPVGLVMVFSPRNEEELETVKLIVKKSYEYAIGPSILG
ncbi:MAG: hypothetical protein AAGD96_30785 [Chloroflexota bacterium]